MKKVITNELIASEVLINKQIKLINGHLKFKKNTITFRRQKIHYVATSEWKKSLQMSEASEDLINKQISIILIVTQN